jgi:hypothetical protein
MIFVPFQLCRRSMGLLSVIGLCAAVAFSANAQTPESPGTPEFGPTEHMSGVFFSNFENAKFFLCPPTVPACQNWSKADDYTLSCEKDACALLNEKIKANTKKPDQTVYLRITLTGKRSKGKASPKFLGDPGRTIQVEQIESVAVIQSN